MEESSDGLHEKKNMEDLMTEYGKVLRLGTNRWQLTVQFLKVKKLIKPKIFIERISILRNKINQLTYLKTNVTFFRAYPMLLSAKFLQFDTFF